MTLAARIAERLGMFDAASVERQTQLLRAYGLPTDLPPGTAPGQLLGLTLQDKKVRAGRPRWVLPTAIGAATVRDDVPEALVRAVVAGA